MPGEVVGLEGEDQHERREQGDGRDRVEERQVTFSNQAVPFARIRRTGSGCPGPAG